MTGILGIVATLFLIGIGASGFGAAMLFWLCALIGAGVISTIILMGMIVVSLARRLIPV